MGLLYSSAKLGDSFAQAIEYGQDLVANCEQALGPDPPGTQIAATTSRAPTVLPGG